MKNLKSEAEEARAYYQRERELVKEEFCKLESKLTGKSIKEIRSRINSIKNYDSSIKYNGFFIGKYTEERNESQKGCSDLPSPEYLSFNESKLEIYLEGYLMATNDEEMVNKIRADAQEKYKILGKIKGK